MNTVQGADAVLTNVAEINGRKVKIEKKLRDPTDKNKNKTTQSRQPEVQPHPNHRLSVSSFLKFKLEKNNKPEWQEATLD